MSVQVAFHKGCALFHWCYNQVQFETEAGEIPHGRLAAVPRGISVQTQHADWLATEA